MVDTVIRNEKGQFYSVAQLGWVNEYPDATLVQDAKSALRVIERLNIKDAVEIIEHYGFEDEKLYSLTMEIHKGQKY